MAEKNIRINVKTDSGYDQLYPESKSDIIEFNKSDSNLSSNTVESAIKEIDKNVGSLSTLETENKTNLVSAVNEVKGKIGILENLKTSIKTNIVNAVNNLYDNTIGKTLKTMDEVNLATEEGYYVDALAIKELNNKTEPDFFLTSKNYKDIITIGNLGGGTLTNISGVKCGNLIDLYVQINNISRKVADVPIFTFKDKKYWPIAYGVTNAFISKNDCVAYIGRFSSNGNFSMAISGGTISSSSKAMVLFQMTYACQG